MITCTTQKIYGCSATARIQYSISCIATLFNVHCQSILPVLQNIPRSFRGHQTGSMCKTKCQNAHDLTDSPRAMLFSDFQGCLKIPFCSKFVKVSLYHLCASVHTPLSHIRRTKPFYGPSEKRFPENGYSFRFLHCDNTFTGRLDIVFSFSCMKEACDSGLRMHGSPPPPKPPNPELPK